MIFRPVLLLIASLSLAACATASPISPAPSAPAPSAPAVPASPGASDAPPASPGESAIKLHEAPANLGCDTVGIDYKRMTFRIDPAATEQVTATTDTGVTLTTYWSAGFQPGNASERVIRDAAGKLVVSDGDVLDVPPAAYPRLAGYFVCLSTDKLYVLSSDPS